MLQVKRLIIILYNIIMEKLFQILLNRQPTDKEIKLLRNQNHAFINNYIVGLEEYKDFLLQNQKNVENLVKRELNIINFNNNKLHHTLMETLRNENYNIDKVRQFILKKKNEIKNKVDLVIFNITGKRNYTINYNEFNQIFINNDFDYRQLEFIIVNSDIYNNLVEKEINLFYKKNKISI
jgi:hypothetical protein